VHNFLQNIFFALGGRDNHVIIVAVWLTFAAFLIFLRVASHLHFRAIIFSFQIIDDKEIKNLKAIEKIKIPVLKKTCAEYIRIAERAVTNISTAQIVEKNVSAMSFLGWKYSGLMPFVESFEYGIPCAGFIFAVVFPEYAAVYGLLAVIIFCALRIVCAFFNFRAVRKELIDETVLFIEREIARFYANDSGGAILRLKNDLVNAINSIGTLVSAALEENLSQSLRDWDAALSKATEVHGAMNSGAERLATASDLLASHMQGHSGAMSAQLISLVDGLAEMKTSLQTIAAQSEFITSNQKILEKSLTSYETTLQALTGSIGDGLGAFINLHAQTSAQTINDAMKINIERVNNLLEREQK